MNLDSKITIKEAYLTMFEYLDRYWNKRGMPDEIGNLLSSLSLWDSLEGKKPMDSSIFPEWLNCAEKVINDENSDSGYRGADIQLS